MSYLSDRLAKSKSLPPREFSPLPPRPFSQPRLVEQAPTSVSSTDSVTPMEVVYPAALLIPVNAPPATLVHVEDAVPQSAVSLSYPPSNYQVLSPPILIHVEDKPRPKRS